MFAGMKVVCRVLGHSAFAGVRGRAGHSGVVLLLPWRTFDQHPQLSSDAFPSLPLAAGSL